jgi:hypothetical protein
MTAVYRFVCGAFHVGNRLKVEAFVRLGPLSAQG